MVGATLVAGGQSGAGVVGSDFALELPVDGGSLLVAGSGSLAASGSFGSSVAGSGGGAPVVVVVVVG